MILTIIKYFKNKKNENKEEKVNSNVNNDQTQYIESVEESQLLKDDEVDEEEVEDEYEYEYEEEDEYEYEYEEEIEDTDKIDKKIQKKRRNRKQRKKKRVSFVEKYGVFYGLIASIVLIVVTINFYNLYASKKANFEASLKAYDKTNIIYVKYDIETIPIEQVEGNIDFEINDKVYVLYEYKDDIIVSKKMVKNKPQSEYFLKGVVKSIQDNSYEVAYEFDKITYKQYVDKGLWDLIIDEHKFIISGKFYSNKFKIGNIKLK